MPRLELLCLANSRKLGGRCVAGLRTDGRGWVRLVAPTADGALTFRDYRLGDADEARPLDVLSVGVRQRRPQPHQPENWVIDETPWRLVQRPARQPDLALVSRHLVRGPELLRGGGVSVLFETLAAAPMPASLAVIRPVRPVVRVSREGTQQRRRTRLKFTLRDQPYELVLTDPLWETALEDRRPGEYSWRELMPCTHAPWVVVSLTEPYGDPQECYKIAATLWPSPPVTSPVATPSAARTVRAAAGCRASVTW